MPLFSTVALVCATMVGDGGTVCILHTYDKFQAFSDANCYVAMRNVHYKLNNEMKKQAGVLRLEKGSYNCYSTIAHRDSVIDRVMKTISDGGVMYAITKLDKDR